jgi:hypothetical protein
MDRQSNIYRITPRWYNNVERMENKTIPKQIATATMEAKRGRPHKDGRTRIKKKVFKYNGSKDQAGTAPRPSGMEED